jgi:hypothetical protein
MNDIGEVVPLFSMHEFVRYNTVLHPSIIAGYVENSKCLGISSGSSRISTRVFNIINGQKASIKWGHAREKAVQLGGRMATFTTAQEFVELSKLSAFYPFFTGYKSGIIYGPWLAGYQIYLQKRISQRGELQKDWYWNSDPLSSCNLLPEFWAPGEPNQFGGIEPCLNILNNSLNDEACNKNLRSFAMETGHWYELIDSAKEGKEEGWTWIEAMREEERRNGYMATITSELEMEFIKRIITKPTAWLGARIEGNQWRWISNPNDPWLSNYPFLPSIDTYSNGGTHCLVYQEGELIQAGCSSKFFSYVLEFESPFDC